MRILSVLLVFFVVSLTGCTSPLVPLLPKCPPPESAKIGVSISIPDTMHHYHIGTTIFNNFEEEFRVDGSLEKSLYAEFKRQVTDLGYEFVVIEPTEDLLSLRENHTVSFEKNLILNPDTEPMLKELFNVKKIDMLIIVKTGETDLMVPNTYIRVRDYGVATRNFLALGEVKVFMSTRGTLITKNPYAIWRTGDRDWVAVLDEKGLFGNFGNLSEDDLFSIDKAIKGFSEKIVSMNLELANLKAKKEAKQ